MNRRGRRRSGTFPMPARGPSDYALGDAAIRQVGATWVATVAGVRLEGDFPTRVDAWHAVDRFWTERHERERVEEWKRLQGGRADGSGPCDEPPEDAAGQNR
jgi:hypothetical protein